MSDHDSYYFGGILFHHEDENGVYLAGDTLRFSCGFFMNLSVEINEEVSAALKSDTYLTRLETIGGDLVANFGLLVSTGLNKNVTRANGVTSVTSSVKNIGQQVKAGLTSARTAANANINQGDALNVDGQHNQLAGEAQEAVAAEQQVNGEQVEAVGQEQQAAANAVQAVAAYNWTAVSQNMITQLNNEISTSKTLQSANIARISASCTQLGTMSAMTSGINMIN
jgi:hypothetical protein